MGLQSRSPIPRSLSRSPHCATWVYSNHAFAAFLRICFHMVNAFLRLHSFPFAAFPRLPLQVHGRTIRRHPIIALLPILMTDLMIGLGVWGVLAASQQYSNDKQNQAQVSEQGSEAECEGGSEGARGK